MSDFYDTSIAKHAETVRDTFNLNPTRRRAFVISQDMPWRRNDLEHAQIDSSGPVQYAQVSFVCKTYLLCAPRRVHAHMLPRLWEDPLWGQFLLCLWEEGFKLDLGSMQDKCVGCCVFAVWLGLVFG